MSRDHALAFALTLVVLASAPGCNGPGDGPALPPPRVPTKGKVTLDGNPLAGAVVIFLPVDESGTLTQSDTEADGSYDLKLATFPGGTAPGRYKVGISYLVGPSGAPQGTAPRAALQPSKDFLEAKELLPPKYSDLGRTELTVTVPPEGGEFHFDLKGPLLPGPEPKAATEASATTPPETSGTTESPTPAGPSAGPESPDPPKS